ncbi:hypothetical protein ET445_07135 [Agromyces protaetiae]|uniref:OsmC family peroxiredoxin n=1 Tax=Agromyces protaetiae TaxID=2509455 RepID=A0A4P6FBZ5_9MICO|nr:OsmC family protein [Agromyces protaetiae]QAY73156.1 hypothetical protein ET445_07135 [Agromyces protaetiae]
MTDVSHEPSTIAGTGSVSATRVAPRIYEARNERGASVVVGGSELDGTHFTPGELLKLALITCAGLSTDRVISRRLGDDYRVTLWAHGLSDPDSNAYERIGEEMLLDLSSLSADDRSKLIGIIGRAIDQGCTVKRSVDEQIEVGLVVDGETVH